MKQKHPFRLAGLFFAVCAVAAIFGGCRAVKADGWDVRTDGTYYLEQGVPLTGWQELGGQRYCFSSDGVMYTGFQQIDGETYFFLPDGTMADGWQEIQGSRFYFRENGTLVTGWLCLDDGQFYLDADGTAVSGPTEVNGTVYLFNGDGCLTSGWVDLDGKRCYGDADGRPVTGWQDLDGGRFCFDESGYQITGWLDYDGFRYYYLDNGLPAQGVVDVDGETCFFSASGQQIILANPWNQIPADYTVELQSIDENHQVASIAYADFQEMMADCRAAGLRPAVCSSYRTQEYQEKLFARKVAFYTRKGYAEDEARELAGRSVAVPGTSEHQLGLALDIVDNGNWKLDESQAKTATQQWLMAHSWEYGWILRYPEGSSEQTGIIYEPWHYRYVGRETAADLHSRGVCLEEYLDLLTAVG